MATYPDNDLLVTELQQGSERAFKILYKQYSAGLYANIFKLVKDQAETEEILQDVFLALWNRKSGIDPQKPLGAWLTVVSYHKSLNHLGKKVKDRLLLLGELPLDLPDVPDISDSQLSEQLAILNKAIDELPTRKREAFTLCKLEGKTYEEAGAILGISTYTVREYIQAASQKVRVYVSENYPSASLSILIVWLITA